MKDCIRGPDYLVLKTGDIYRKFYSSVCDILKNRLDVVELFNQAIDVVTNVNGHTDIDFVNFDMLRACNLSVDETTCITNAFNITCDELRGVLRELNMDTVIDMTTSHEIYPYYFHKLVNGRVILKHF